LIRSTPSQSSGMCTFSMTSKRFSVDISVT
jgi:hypothetical protein